jgi:hypothetical protein
MINQSLIDKYGEEVKIIYDRTPALPELEKAMMNSLKKYTKHKHSASRSAYLESKEMGWMGIHPFLTAWVSDQERSIMDVQETLRKFRPK